MRVRVVGACLGDLPNQRHPHRIRTQEGVIAKAGVDTAGAMTMISIRPQYYLVSEANASGHEEIPAVGHWRFVLESTDGTDRLEAEDCEPTMDGERLELLTVIRGLEALDQPSAVTLVTPSSYVSRGLRYGLNQWRRNAWCWEYDGRMIPVTNCDLWQRLDRALRYHDVHCRWLRPDERSVASGSWLGRRLLPHRQNPARRRFWQTVSDQLRQGVGLLLWAVSAPVRLRPAA